MFAAAAVDVDQPQKHLPLQQLQLLNFGLGHSRMNPSVTPMVIQTPTLASTMRNNKQQ